MKDPSSFGILYIVATPLGNLEDITLRALRILKEVDYIIAEDTRHSRKLLTHFQISKKMVSFYEHNEAGKIPQIMMDLQSGQNIALVSDAGTPSISDPGFSLIRLAKQNDMRVVPVPGPSAIVAALSASGLPTDRFQFIGFLSPKAGKKKKLLETLKEAQETLIFFESPHRLLKTCHLMYQIWGDRTAVVAREMTKKHEEITRRPLSQWLDILQKNPPRGEVTLLVAGRGKDLDS